MDNEKSRAHEDIEEEEKVLDWEGVEEDAEEAEKVAEEAKRKRVSGSYTHHFKKPFKWKEREFDSLTFDWTALTGRDHLAIENEIVMKGRTLVSPAFTGAFLAGMAARACTERDKKGHRVINGQALSEMSMGDFQAITREARSFLLLAE